MAGNPVAANGRGRRIVLTGGPGAGKTAVATALAARFPERFICVPEAASQVYGALGTRWDRLDVAGRRQVQRRIYALQVAQEERLAAGNPGRTLLLDRGTVDGSAYWPDGPQDYWQSIGTTAAAELGRYDAVIWLETTAGTALYDGCSSNPCRHEDAALAVERGLRVAELWAEHRCLYRVGVQPTLEAKIAAVLAIIDAQARSTSGSSG